MAIEIRNIITRESLSGYDMGFLKRPEFGGWRIEEDTARLIGRACEEFKPRHVLEFGTGLSTLVLANEASKGNVERIWSVDHLKDFPGHPRGIIGKDGPVEFCHLPIRLTTSAGKLFQFYSVTEDFLKKVGPIDLVIIDGPPYYYNSREASLYKVYPYLSKDAVILLDDAGRKGREEVYLSNWKRYFGDKIETNIFLKEFKKGLAYVRPVDANGKISGFKAIERIKDSSKTIKYELLRILRYMRDRLVRRAG